MKEYKVSSEVLEGYLNTKYQEVMKSNYYLLANEHIREKVLELLRFESLIRNGKGIGWIQKMYDELIEEWYKKGEIRGEKMNRISGQEAGVMIARIIREEMYGNE